MTRTDSKVLKNIAASTFSRNMRYKAESSQLFVALNKMLFLSNHSKLDCGWVTTKTGILIIENCLQLTVQKFSTIVVKYIPF